MGSIAFILEQPTNSEGKNLFRKKPLGRRWYLMSKPARSGICEFSTTTSGTEWERGFVGIDFCRSVPLVKMYSKQTLFLKHLYLLLSFNRNKLVPQNINLCETSPF